MSDQGGHEAALRRRTTPPGPLDMADLLGEILLRLPSNPSSLARASLVCKGWRSVASSAAFRRRLRAHHRKPPILGVFELRAGDLVFTSLLEPPDRIPPERFALRVGAAGDFWSFLGCLPTSVEARMVIITGYSEEADAIFISVYGFPNSYRGVFIVQLDSMEFIESCPSLLTKGYHPFVDFYTAGC